MNYLSFVLSLILSVSIALSSIFLSPQINFSGNAIQTIGQSCTQNSDCNTCYDTQFIWQATCGYEQAGKCPVSGSGTNCVLSVPSGIGVSCDQSKAYLGYPGACYPLTEYSSVCGDGKDNDKDGLADCSDSDCTGTSSCPTCESGNLNAGSCSSTKPKYCQDQDYLIDKCGTCGCPTGQICQAWGACTIPTPTPTPTATSTPSTSRTPTPSTTSQVSPTPSVTTQLLASPTTSALASGIPAAPSPTSSPSSEIKSCSSPVSISCTPPAVLKTEKDTDGCLFNYCFDEAKPEGYCGDGLCGSEEDGSSCSSDCPKPTPTPSAEPVITTQTPTTKPSTSCTSDSDCSWLIINSCPETAGALWSCSSINQPLPTYSGNLCPQVLSPKPLFDCGCVQSICTIYQGEKPTQSSITNTRVSAAVLLSASLQLDEARVKLEFLKSATSKLSSYYQSKGSMEKAVKWSTASTLLQEAVNKIDSLKKYLAAKIQTFSTEDLKDFKNKLTLITDVISEVLDAVA